MPASRTALLRLLGAFAALALLVAACSGDDAPDDGPVATDGSTGGDGGATGDTLVGVPDPCELASLDDLQGSFGTPFGAGTLTDQPQTGFRRCTWTGTDTSAVQVVSIAVGTEGSLQAALQRGAGEVFDLTRGSFDASGSIHDPDLGIGDRSYRALSSIYVLDGDTSYTFTSSSQDDRALAALADLAAEVVEG